MSTTKSYADTSTKITKALYGKSVATQAELEKDMEYIFNLQMLIFNSDKRLTYFCIVYVKINVI